VRELDRERNSLLGQEKKYSGEVRKAANAGQVDAAKVREAPLSFLPSLLPSSFTPNM
jgi:hypothetical protein